MKKQLLTIGLLLLSMLAGNLYAQTSKLSVQGVLRNSNGTAVENGHYRIVFKLWDEATGGNLIWNETRDSIRLEGGIYSVVLGDGDKVLDAPFDQPYYLGVAIGGGTEMIPRASLTSSPYALALIGSDNVFPNSGNVGVGASDPLHKLTVQNGTGILGLNAEDGAPDAVITSASDGLKFKTSDAYIFEDDNNGETMRINTDGNVGIGTDDPQNHLHVVGDNEQIKVEGTNNANIGFYKTTNNSGKGTLGFVPNFGNHLVLNNTIGETHIKGNSIHLNPTTGATNIDSDANVEGELNIIKNGEALKLKGTSTSYLGFYPQTGQGRKAFLGFGSDNSNDVKLNNESSNGDIILTTNNGSVKVQDALHVSGWDQIHVNGNTRRYLAGGNHSNYINSNVKFNITATDNIRSKGFWIHSDQRIKKDITPSSQKSDLARLNKIQIADYKYKDAFRHGNSVKKGVMAQQVSTVFPEAVSYSKNFIPNIFAYPEAISRKGDQFLITMDKAHSLKIGDLIRCENDQSEFSITVSAIIDDQTFAIDHSTMQINKEVFFFGTEVNDFHTVDYDQIFTLCVSAVQELSDKLERLEKENAQLKSFSAKKDSMLQTEIQTLNTRMKAMENLFSTTSNN